MKKYKILNSNNVIRDTDEVGYISNGKQVWHKTGGHGFKVKDCMSGNKYRRLL